MDVGEFLTRTTIWLSIVGYVTGSVLFASSRNRTQWDPAARAAWTIACASLIAHFISAFHFYHHWSHSAAYLDTARQTNEMFGFNWGGGLYINYALLIAWIVDIAWWWRSSLGSYRSRPRWLLAIWHGFFIFIIFNATVVFGEGPVRWVGLVTSLLLAVIWVRQR